MRWLTIFYRMIPLLACLTAPAAAEDAPRIVVTIAPVHSLVAGIAEGVAEPTLIMQGTASPHAFAMKPSQAKALEGADVIVRVGETLETSLDKPIEALGTSALVVTLDGAPDMRLLPMREGGVWEAHDHAHDHAKDSHDHDAHDHGKKDEAGVGAKAQDKDSHGHDDHGHSKAEDAHDDHGHGDQAHNPHIWLDPKNAIVAVDQIAQALAKADPDHAGQYETNAAKLKQKLTALDAELTELTKPLHGQPYLVFHDAYPYFESRYGLNPVGAITVSPERQPGAKRIGQIRAKVRELGAVCIFAEPQFEPKLIGTIVDGTQSRSGVLDPLGASLEPGPDLYFTLMRNMAQALGDCLNVS